LAEIWALEIARRVTRGLDGPAEGRLSSKTVPFFSSKSIDLPCAAPHTANDASRLRKLWPGLQSQGIQKTTEKVQISDGFNLGQLLDEDLRDDVALISMISFIFGTFFLLVCSIVIKEYVVLIILPFWLSCILCATPLSRFWMPEWLFNVCSALVNAGLKFY
jgi:hypothetical protein